MVTLGPAAGFLGRHREREVLDLLLGAVRGGQSGVLVVHGDPGVGKTALLRYAIESASGFRVVQAMGVESEMELPFAALQQLCAPIMDRQEGLPEPQRQALGVAFGLRTGDAPDRFLVGLAVLGLLAEVADEQPLLCVVDDAQWLDRASEQVLAFVARRLLAEAVGLVFAAREPSEELRGMPELIVHGLRNGDARALLSSVLPAPLDEQVRDRIVAETHGNPLALLELPRGLSPAELAGGFGMPVALPLSGRIEDSFRRRLGLLPVDTQRLLLVAAAEPVGDPVLLWRAAERVGIDVGAAEAAQSEGLLEVGAGVTFRHPLVRSAVYRSASPRERREVHDALAEATDPELDPDRRAWHRAQATAGPDEDVASELERSAGRAQARGGLAAAAAFLERAAGLTLDAARRAARALAAAQAKYQAGAFDAALALAAAAASGPLDEFQRAQVDLLCAHISFASNRGSEAPALLIRAARRFELLDVRLAREIYLDVLFAGLLAGGLASRETVLEVAEAARAGPAPPQPARPSDLLLDGLGLLITDGHLAAVPVLRRALNAFREEISPEDGLRWLWTACHAAGLLWDYDSFDVLSARRVKLARETGALSVPPTSLTTRAISHLLAGELAVASSLVEEADAITEATLPSIAPHAGLGLVAFRGREGEASQLIESATRDFLRRGEAIGLTYVQWATAVLYNGLGRYENAAAAAQQAAADSNEQWFSMLGLVELIEAGIRTGKVEPAETALERLAETTTAAGTDWAVGIEARSRALLSDGEAADTLYRQAIDALAGSRLRVDVARAHLLYGEWLRRGRRQLDARQQLRIAYQQFTEFGMEAFAERARLELAATGTRARRRTVGAIHTELTAQEAQIACLARDGLSNPEIGTRLFISAHTVQYHLRKVFTKLGITSRSQLDRVLPPERNAVRRTRQ